MTSKDVYILYHVHPEDEIYDEDWKLIGVYDEKEKAEMAISRLKSKAGFVDLPDGFRIITHVLNWTGWVEGYERS